MRKSVFRVLAFALAAAGACLAQSQQEPSLGDLARQHHEEKKPIKVFTNEDVTTSSPSVPMESPKMAAVPASSGDAKAGKKEEAKTGDKKESAGKDTSAGKDSPEVAELKQKLSSYKEQQEGWKKSAKRYQDLLSTETSDFRRQMYQDALQGDESNIQLYQNKIDHAQSDLEKAEKESPSNR
jgi:hypothetical protein